MWEFCRCGNKACFCKELFQVGPQALGFHQHRDACSARRGLITSDQGRAMHAGLRATCDFGSLCQRDGALGQPPIKVNQGSVPQNVVVVRLEL